MRGKFYHIGRVGNLIWFAVCLTVIFPACIFGQVNSWVKPSSGNWDEAANWSLGVLPGSAHSILIANSGWKSVSINPSTPAGFPEAMTVNSLTIRGAWDTRNVLLLNYFGTAVPLAVLNGLTLQDMAQIVNLSSGLDIQGGTFTATNAQIVQDGGFIRATNAPLHLQGAEYHLTNGLFEGGTVLLGSQDSGIPSLFNQYGGAVTIASLGFVRGPGTARSGYALHGGYLYLPGGLRVTGENNTATSYLQTGGTNGTTEVLVEAGLFGVTPEFKLNGGLLAAEEVSVLGDNFGSALLEHNGGTHAISNTLTLAGGSRHGQTVLPGTYRLAGGTLSARVIELNGNMGDAVFAQTNGTTTAESIWAHSVGWFTMFNTSILLMGGTLTCSNLTIQDGRGLLFQGGGALVVTHLLEVGGVRNLEFGDYYGSYNFADGTLSASNIHIIGDWSIGDSSGANRISNPGYCRLGHRLVISNAVEQLGRCVLGTSATLDLAGSTSRLGFADSSGETWADGATLLVLGWNGSSSGGGAERLTFGTGDSALTQAQLNRIFFRMGADLYSAKLLSTGEVVPNQVVLPMLAFSRQGNKLVLSWPAGFSLQTATNIAGPYIPVSGTGSPYTNEIGLDPQRFFRLGL